MPIQYQADYRTLRDFTQPEITPLTKRMSDITTLADLMDKRKANAMTLAAAEKKLREEEELRKRNQAESAAYQNRPAAIEAPVAPTLPQIPEVSAIQPSAKTYEQAITGPQPLVTPQAPPDMMGPPAPAMEAPRPSLDQYMASPAAQQGQQDYATQKAAQDQATEQNRLAQQQYEQQQGAYKKNVEARELPKWVSDVGWDEKQYGEYLARSKINPAIGQDFLKQHLDMQKNIAEVSETRAKATGLTQKQKDLEDFQAGAILANIPETATYEDKKMALMNAMGINSIEADTKLSQEGALKSKYANSPAMLKGKELTASLKLKESKEVREQAKEQRESESSALKNALDRWELASKQGEAAEKQEAKAKVYESVRNNLTEARDKSQDLVNKLKSYSGLFGSGHGINPISKQGQEVIRAMDVLKSSLALDKLNEMKQATRTGASGLGATNEKEFDALATSTASLKADPITYVSILLDQANNVLTRSEKLLRMQAPAIKASTGNKPTVHKVWNEKLGKFEVK